ncbi:cyclic nucleotide-binding domain-containing protein [Rhodopila sp.]|uniref:cyclic nucleotide-binding domain-containing protein n=1 Tax=Rhodopila sp. TaxID=2480087 RepID=UPI003D0FBCDB
MSHATLTLAPNPADGRLVTQALRAIPLLRDLDESLMDRLARISKIISAPAGTEVCRQAEAPDVLYIVLDGQLAASSTAANGSAAVVEVIRPGAMIGLATLLARLPRLLNARAIGHCRLLSIEAAGLLSLVEQETSLVTALLRAEAQDFHALVRQVCDLKLRTTAQRLGCYLLSLCTEPSGNVVALRLPFDKRLLAARLGCRQENLSRAFATLRGLGVETHGARVILHDIASLRDYALPDDPIDAD